MPFKPCDHPDVRFYNDLGCCLSCGEVIDSVQVSKQKPVYTPSVAIESPDRSPFYTYQDLNLSTGQEIRLMQLLPGSWTDPIQCSITMERLQERPEPYEALSYTWATEEGDDTSTGRVYCENAIIGVTKNCEAVLRRLRRSHYLRRLWVDAVCVNQSNVQERNHQVGLMDQIYLKASNVCICIEDPRQDYTECARWLQTGEHATHAALIQTAELFQKRYFTRVWVIQEVVLASYLTLQLNEDSILLSGRMRRPFFDVCERYGITVPRLLQNPASSSANPIIHCLKMSMDASSADPRDKFYGIVSLLKPETRAMIQVDYNFDYNRILRDVVVACIEESEDLTILLYIKPENHMDDMTNLFSEEDFHDYVRHSIPIYDSLQSCRRNQFYTPNHHPLKHEKTYQFPVEQGGVVRRLWLPCISTLAPEPAYAYDMESADARYHAKSLVSYSYCYDLQHLGLCQSLQQQILPYFTVRGHLIDMSQGLMSIKARDLVPMGQGVDVYMAYPWLLKYFTDENNRTNERDVRTFVRYIEANRLAADALVFTTHYSVGYTTTRHNPGDCVFAVDGVPEPLLLRPLGNETYKIIGRCYLWAALELNYWNTGSHLGLWPDRPVDLGSKQTRMIELY